MDRFGYSLTTTAAAAILLLLVCEPTTAQFDPITRPVQIFVNVYDHPKTGFSCQGKNPGEYYADPATKCAVYYVCIPNPAGQMSAQSFACPNGTIFSQATRVCRPHEEVFCPLATRYYNSVQGSIDTHAGPHDILMPGSLPVGPEVPPPPRPQPVPVQPNKSNRARQPPPVSQPKPVPVSNQFTNNARYARTRGQQQNPITTTTTTVAPPTPETPNGDYEYDYADYVNETNPAAASSSPKASSADPADTVSGSVIRQKRETSRQKLMDSISGTAIGIGDETFTCQDKLAGVAYADQQDHCRGFFVCIMVAKGKLMPYRFDCPGERRFDQKRSVCTEQLPERACHQSHQYYVRNKWFAAPGNKHLLNKKPM